MALCGTFKVLDLIFSVSDLFVFVLLLEWQLHLKLKQVALMVILGAIRSTEIIWNFGCPQMTLLLYGNSLAPKKKEVLKTFSLLTRHILMLVQVPSVQC